MLAARRPIAGHHKSITVPSLGALSIGCHSILPLPQSHAGCVAAKRFTWPLVSILGYSPQSPSQPFQFLSLRALMLLRGLFRLTQCQPVDRQSGKCSICRLSPPAAVHHSAPPRSLLVSWSLCGFLVFAAVVRPRYNRPFCADRAMQPASHQRRIAVAFARWVIFPLAFKKRVANPLPKPARLACLRHCFVLSFGLRGWRLGQSCALVWSCWFPTFGLALLKNLFQRQNVVSLNG